jgi:hypothetical protein
MEFGHGRGRRGNLGDPLVTKLLRQRDAREGTIWAVRDHRSLAQREA